VQNPFFVPEPNPGTAVPTDTPSTSFDAQARIAQLFVYPIKSCAGVAVQEALLTETGLDLDRAWMLVDRDGDFVSQRELPRMALVQPRLRHYDLVLRAPGMLGLHLQIDTVEAACTARVWGDTVKAFDMGDLAAQWFSTFLAPELASGEPWPYRLVRFDPEQRRLSNLAWTGGIEAANQFSDGYPVLVAGTASLEGLNRRLEAAGKPPVDMVRFRPNIVLEGLDEHDEDRLSELHIGTPGGAVVLRQVKPCSRCPIPDIDPRTATSSHDVGDMLQTYRKDARLQGAVSFGMHAIVLSGQDQVLRVGQVVQGNYRFD